MEKSLFTPAVFAGSLARTFEYRTRGVHATPDGQWRFTTPGTISRPVLVDQGVIYLADDLGSVSALEASSGRYALEHSAGRRCDKAYLSDQIICLCG